jgi:hypothetical protein
MRRARLLLILACVAAGTFVVAPAGRATTGLEGVPGYDHVFTIVLENENYDATWTALPAPDPYLRSLRASGAFADQYYGISHVSADNYIAMTSGQPATPLFNSDCEASWAACEGFEKAWPDGGRSIGDQVDYSGRSWKAYMDAMSGPCQHPGTTAVPDPYQTGYATRHDPFVYYPPIVENTTRCNAHVVPYTDTASTTGLATDLVSATTTPNYVFITPDTCHDGHDAPCTGAEAGQPGGLASADAWLSTEVPKILSSPAFNTPGVNSLLVITFDENGFSDLSGCCGALASGAGPTTDVGAFGGRVGLLAIGAGVTAGKTIHTPYDHWSYLRTVEDGLDIGEHLNLAGLPTTPAMTDLFG